MVVKLVLSNKLEGHPRLPKGAVGCMFAFASEDDAKEFDDMHGTSDVIISQRDFVRMGMSKVRKTIIKNSRKGILEEKGRNKKKQEETKE